MAGQILADTGKAPLSCARQEGEHTSPCQLSHVQEQEPSLTPLHPGWTGLSQCLFLSSCSRVGVLPSAQTTEQAGPAASARPWLKLPMSRSLDQGGSLGQVDARGCAFLPGGPGQRREPQLALAGNSGPGSQTQTPAQGPGLWLGPTPEVTTRGRPSC